MQGTADVVGPRPDRHPMLARTLADVAIVGLTVGLVITVLDALVRPPDAALSDGDCRLRFAVTDDGAGFDPSTTSPGTGLQGIADRLAALGGEVEVRSAPGEGTTVAGSLPIC